MLFRLEEIIDAPADAVWRQLSDPTQMQRWMNGIEQMRSADGRPPGTSSTLVFMARGAQRTTKITEFEPLQRMTLVSTRGPVTATYTYVLNAAGGKREQTAISLEAECVASGWAVIFMPLLAPLIRRADGGQLKALKKLVEDEGN